MEKIEGKSFERVEVVADGKSFVKCEFSGCSITHSGDKDTEFVNCTFRSCEWIFAGAVERTLKISG